MPIQPYAARHTTEDLGDRLKIKIASRKHWFIIFFLGFWLVGWAFGEVTAVWSLFRGQTLSGSSLFMIVWLVFWTLGGIFAILILSWQLFGMEVIEISFQGITTNRTILGFGFPKEYSTDHINALRISPNLNTGEMYGWLQAGRGYGFQGGLLTFDYGAKTIRFGSGIEEAEAKQIFEEITQRFPQYRSRPNP